MSLTAPPSASPFRLSPIKLHRKPPDRRALRRHSGVLQYHCSGNEKMLTPMGSPRVAVGVAIPQRWRANPPKENGSAEPRMRFPNTCSPNEPLEQFNN